MYPRLQLVRFSLVVMSVLAGGLFESASAQSYEVSVTRKSRNVYKVDGKDIIIFTRYCYVYAYSEESILRSPGSGGSLIFIQSKDNCDVKAVYGAADVKPGKYSVTVSREEDDWYELWGTGTFAKTSACLSLALGEQAYLTVQAGEFGRLVFKDGNSCLVEGLYSRLRLSGA